MKLVILESPYAGDIETHVTYARRCLRDSLMKGEAPIASHLLYTQEGVLDDSIVEERELGINAGLAWRSVAQGTVVYTDYGVSKGMQYGIDKAEKSGKPVIYRKFGDIDLVEIVRSDAETKFSGFAQVENGSLPEYTLSIHIEGACGFYQYKVGTLDQAMNHFAAITSTGYRRVNDRGMMEWYSPKMVKFIKIDGPGLDSNYSDNFVRT